MEFAGVHPQARQLEHGSVRVVAVSVALAVIDDGRAKHVLQVLEVAGQRIPVGFQCFAEAAHGKGLPGAAQQLVNAVKPLQAIHGFLPAQAFLSANRRGDCLAAAGCAALLVHRAHHAHEGAAAGGRRGCLFPVGIENRDIGEAEFRKMFAHLRVAAEVQAKAAA